ncbi:unnamed protein product [Owenia fusiformis]|uniref:Phosphorylated adapter RNA export protein n=1 Tax=Owenia fusiformis TaxID=6347 RepID=A0A8J1XUT7_OWEFU|nr:unnamed protein product [Owenia fusiformis]
MEDGEISGSDEEIGASTKAAQSFMTIQTNIPAKSPPNIPSYRAPQTNNSSSEDSDSNDSDEDDDGISFKRKKSSHSTRSMDFNSHSTFQNPILLHKQQNARNDFSNGNKTEVTSGSKGRRKNNIWGSVVQEQAVSSVLTSFGMDRNPSDDEERNVESYDYKSAKDDTRPDIEKIEVTPNDPFEQILKGSDQKDNEDEMPVDNIKPLPDAREKIEKSRARKRTVRDRLGQRTYDKHKPRDHLKATPEDPIEKVLEVILQRLDEKNEELFTNIMNCVGSKKALELLYLTEDVEESGGMMIMNGQRRRTPGGVYIQLLKSDKSVTKEMLDEIFACEKIQDRKRAQRRKQFRRKKQNTSQDSLMADLARYQRERERMKAKGHLGESNRPGSRSSRTSSTNSQEMENDDESDSIVKDSMYIRPIEPADVIKSANSNTDPLTGSKDTEEMESEINKGTEKDIIKPNAINESEDVELEDGECSD